MPTCVSTGGITAYTHLTSLLINIPHPHLASCLCGSTHVCEYRPNPATLQISSAAHVPRGTTDHGPSSADTSCSPAGVYSHSCSRWTICACITAAGGRSVQVYADRLVTCPVLRAQADCQRLLTCPSARYGAVI